MYTYKAFIRNIIDGDTIDVDIDLGFGVWIQDQRVRLYGIDTPESRTRDLTEKLFGLAAKNFVISKLPISSTQVLKTFVNGDGDNVRGKFGRILGDFIIEDDKTLVNTMIAEGYGVVYNGQSKELIREGHLKNRELLIKKGVVSV